MNNIPNEAWSQLEGLAGEERADACLNLSYSQFQSSNYSAAQILCGSALDIYFNLGATCDVSKIQDAYKGLSHSFKHLGKFEEAAEISLQAAEYLQSFDDEAYTEALNIAADSYYSANLCGPALAIYTKILENPMNIFEDESLARLFVDIAFCHQGLGNYLESNEYFKKARSLFVRSIEPRNVAFIDEEIALNYYHLENAVDCMKYARYCLDYAIMLSDKPRLIYSHNRMGLAKLLNHQFDAAISHFNRCKELSTKEQKSDFDLIISCERGLEAAYRSAGKVAEAEVIARRISNVLASNQEIH
jgi:tetratricopeptide (TPR) repeat protein